jgi:hypothetical protein
MKHSFLCPDKVRKISVASYMWFLVRILRGKSIGGDLRQFGKSRWGEDKALLVHIVPDERGVDEERDPLSR